MPSKTEILELVRSTCAQVSQAHSTHVRIDEEAVAHLAAELDPDVVKGAHTARMLPVRFEDQTSEVNFMALYRLLDFGSGWDPVLKERCKRDAQETMQFGVLGAHLSGKKLDTKWMKGFDSYTVHNLFGIDSRDEEQVPNLPGVTMSKPGVLAPFSNSIIQTIRDAGAALDEGEGAGSLGEYVMRVVSQLHKSKHPAPASALVEELCDVIPGFADTALYEGTRVIYARKAQGLVADLAARFKGEDERFNWADEGKLTADSGSLIPAVLRARGVLVLSPELAAIIDAGTELKPSPYERALRAAAVTAVDALAAAAAQSSKPVTARELSSYLSLLAGEGGQLKRHLTRETVAY